MKYDGTSTSTTTEMGWPTVTTAPGSTRAREGPGDLHEE